jgi:PiT family inorganic phosphate transporter
VHSLLLLVIVVGAALAFDFTNGFHDTANVIAAAIATRSMSPRVAIAMAAVLNFAGAFISLKVAATVATGIVDANRITETIVFAGLVGATLWNLATWAFGLPSSSSHALIGGVSGAMLAAVGGGVKVGGLVDKVIVPALVAPLAAFLIAAVVITIVYRLFAQRNPGTVKRGFRGGQILSSAVLAIAHGTNDAQKTMGVITLALVAHGTLSPQHLHVPTWVVICSASAIALGTYAGGWRIIRTVGSRIIRMDPAQGFVAQSTSAVVILVSSHLGYPLSSTHVISGGIVGAGAGKSVNAVRWGVARSIAVAWVITLPLAGLFGAAVYGISRGIGSGTTGPLVIAIVALLLVGGGTANRRRRLTAAAAAAAMASG